MKREGEDVEGTASVGFYLEVMKMLSLEGQLKVSRIDFSVGEKQGKEETK